MQKLPINIVAEWDPEASVWVATSEDIGGFVMEDATLERLVSRVPDVLEDLIELNNVELPIDLREVPFEVHALQTGFAALGGLKVQGYYKALRKLLEAAGCTLVRYGKGDHQIWYSPISKQNVTVDGGVMSRHSANGILRQAGLPKAF